MKYLNLAAFLGLILAANYATTEYGLIPVGFGLMATAGTYLAGLTVQPRCPICTAPTEGDKCGLRCDIKRCDDCRELYDVGKPHEHSATCAECGDRFLVSEGCTGHLDGDYCGSCFAVRCRECRDDAFAEREVE